MIDHDVQFFQQHPGRYAHIRAPRLVPVVNKQRAAGYMPECEAEFRSLGDHKRERRRIILWRVPEQHPAYDAKEVKILKIPFLAFADETIEDIDEVLLPIVQEIMEDAAKKQGLANALD